MRNIFLLGCSFLRLFGLIYAQVDVDAEIEVYWGTLNVEAGKAKYNFTSHFYCPHKLT